MTSRLASSTARMSTAPRSAARVRLRVAQLGCVPYGEALALQERLVAARADDTIGDRVLLLEHPPVYTLGRGGGATFHGPGQLVAYPIVRLRAAGRDVHAYVRSLEAALVATCAQFGVTAIAPSGQTGVWVGDRKIAAIGIGVRRGVAYHGIALNVSTDLTYFAHIVACRTPGLATTSLAELLGAAPPVMGVGERFAANLAERLGFAGVELETAQ